MVFQVLMVRTYETVLTYEANSLEEDIKLAMADESRYSVELEQCCVVDEYYEEF